MAAANAAKVAVRTRRKEAMDLLKERKKLGASEDEVARDEKKVPPAARSKPRAPIARPGAALRTARAPSGVPFARTVAVKSAQQVRPLPTVRERA